MSNQRKFERFSCEGSGDILTGEAGRLWGHLGDISLGGFYLSTFGPWPVNTDVQFKIEVHGVQISGKGVVTTSHPGVGMAVAFKDLTGEAEGALTTVVHELQTSGCPSLGAALRV